MVNDDAQSVAPGAELRHRPFRPRVVRRLDLGHRQFELERVNRQLGLDLEAARQHRKRFHEAPREHPVAGQDIGEGRAEHRGDEGGQQPVSGAVAAAVRRLRPPRRAPPPPCRAGPRSAARSSRARSARRRWRRRRPERRRRRRRRRTSAAPRCPCPGGSPAAPPRRPRGRPRRCGRWNCCRRRRRSPPAARPGNRATTLAMAASSLKQGTRTATRWPLRGRKSSARAAIPSALDINPPL